MLFKPEQEMVNTQNALRKSDDNTKLDSGLCGEMWCEVRGLDTILTFPTLDLWVEYLTCKLRAI